MACAAAQSPEIAPPPASPPASAPPPDPDAEVAPRPFTAAQLREACRAGRVMTFVMERPPKPPVKRRMTFLVADDERATIVSELLGDQNEVLGTPETQTATWDELRRHATYPRATTTIMDAVAEVPAGSFPCKRYTILEGAKKTVACFASELPGPPVELVIEEDGRLLLSMELLKNQPGE